MSDTPINPRTFPPPPMIEQIKGLIGDLARPYAIIVTASSAAIAVVLIAANIDDGSAGAIFIAAVFAGLGGIYTAKAWENNTQAKEAAKVEVAKATATTTQDGAAVGSV